MHLSQRQLGDRNPIRTPEHSKFIDDARGNSTKNCKNFTSKNLIDMLDRCIDENWDTEESCYNDLFSSEYFWS